MDRSRRNRIAIISIMTYYARQIFDETKLYETSWKFTADYLILIDFDTIHLDWPKYENRRYNPEFVQGFYSNVFSRWLGMYKNFKIDWV